MNVKEYIERFDETLQHFDKVMQSILSIFVYLVCMLLHSFTFQCILDIVLGKD